MAPLIAMNTHPVSVRLDLSVNLRLLWNLLRVPVLGVLLLLAPVVDFACGGLLLLGVLVSFAFRLSGVGAGFPFWQMIAWSLGFGLFVILYHAVIGLLAR